MPRLTANSWPHSAIVLHRLEFPLPLNYLCQASWGACYAVSSAHELTAAPVVLAIVVNLLLILSGLALNVTADIRGDSQHQEKAYLADSAKAFGRTRALRWIVAEMAAAVVLAALISWWRNEITVLVLALLTVAGHLLYNLEPVRLKRRGLAGPVVFGLSVTTLPCLLSAVAVRANFEGSLWLVFTGLGVLAIARTVWWSTSDRQADEASGMKTPAVRYGNAGAAILARALSTAGICLLAGGLLAKYGLLWTLVGSAAHLIFFGTVLGRKRRVLRPAEMLKRAMPWITVADLILAALPLVA
ncbi:UbiA prenyltransferase family protein [Amycolatopsis sp. H20-H5]|uniref:UbiA prenyltransferase family protein n=1 Tax=Amycolatopsis sp. H20-H5 TaxID=3046309 RepID=UPI002DBC7515|nr:UbiA family prenyltransferase [Amycolatopsis sp. H20-H5]MEC3979203.1 UbiA family prenyltransferase [Amycolatopsis sp. H20-H5]